MLSYTIATMENKSDSFSVFFFFHKHWRFTEQRGKGVEHLLFHSITSTGSQTLRHLFATLHMRWVSCIFNRNACVYQNYHLVDWLMIQCLFTWLTDCRFLLQGFNMGNRWICICISPLYYKQTDKPSDLVTPNFNLDLSGKLLMN